MTVDLAALRAEARRPVPPPPDPAPGGPTSWAREDAEWRSFVEAEQRSQAFRERAARARKWRQQAARERHAQVREVVAAGEPWWEHAVCRDNPEVDPEWFHASDRRDRQRAVAVCRGCPVAAECLAAAEAEDDRWGVRGGLTAWQRGWNKGQRRRDKSWLEQEAK